MRWYRTLLLAAALTLPLGFAVSEANAAPESYKIDRTHSEIGFKVRHNMVSWVRGRFGSFEGTLSYDPENIGATSASVQVDPATIDTENEKRDEHLRGDDFFDVAKFPTVTFESTGVKDIEKDGSFTLVGDMTMHGVTKSVDLRFEPFSDAVTSRGRTKRGVSITGKFDRQDFGINWSKLLDNGGLAVGNEIRLVIDLELNQQ